MRIGKGLAVIATAMFFALQPKPSFSQVSSTAIGQPDFPITQLRSWNWDEDERWQPMQLTVPDADTTQSAYGGKLRRYDVHLAKMFEVSHFLCKQNSRLKGLTWAYDAANGNIYMGRFKISCILANEVATAYGLTRLEPTSISFLEVKPEQSRDDPYSRDRLIPVLNISTNGKILRWMNYVQTFQPFFSEDTRRADREAVPFPVSRVLSRIKGKTQIPILIPSEVPNFEPIASIINNNFDVRADANSYSICARNCTKPSVRHFNSFSASVAGDNNLPSRSKNSGPRDTFREIELAHGIRGVFYEGCGAYCTSGVVWKYRGVLYGVDARFGAQPLLVRIANSAIEAGVR